MQSFTELEAWKKGMLLLKEVYRLTKEFPADERFGMTSQLRRASASVLANIAEGFSRATSPDKSHKYTIARGECAEVHALLLASIELEFLTLSNVENAIELVLETGRLLTGLVQKYST